MAFKWNPFTGNLDWVFNPLGPWPGNLNLNCNDLINTGDIIHGASCSADMLIQNAATGDIRIETTTAGAEISLGPFWTSSDTVVFDGTSPAQFVKINPSFTNLTGATTSAFAMRSASVFLIDSGFTGFGTTLGGMSISNTMDTTGSPDNPLNHFGVQAVSSFSGGSRTLASNIAISGQSQTLFSGTITESVGVLGAALAVVGGSSVNAAAIQANGPGVFISGGITTATSLRALAPTAGLTRWTLSVEGTQNSRIDHMLSIGHTTIPLYNTDMLGPIAIRASGGVSRLNFADNNGVAQARIFGSSTNPGRITFAAVNQTFNESLEFDLEIAANFIEFNSPSGASLDFNFGNVCQFQHGLLVNVAQTGTGNFRVSGANVFLFYVSAGLGLIGVNTEFPLAPYTIDVAGSIRSRGTGSFYLGQTGANHDMRLTSFGVANQLSIIGGISGENLVINLGTTDLVRLFSNTGADLQLDFPITTVTTEFQIQSKIDVGKMITMNM